MSGTNGIVVNAGPTDTVILKNLDIEGLGTGLNGITVLAGLNVYVINTRIHHFLNNGINMASSTSGARLIVQNSQILRNGTSGSNPLTGGINVNGTANVIDAAIRVFRAAKLTAFPGRPAREAGSGPRTRAGRARRWSTR